MSGLKPTQQDAVKQRLQAKAKARPASVLFGSSVGDLGRLWQVKDLRKEYGPRVPQLQRMTRAFALMTLGESS